MIELPPDYTFVIQVVSFVVFWQLMRVLLFIPTQRALAARAAHTDGARERAAALNAQAGEITREVDAVLADARQSALREAEAVRRRSESEEEGVLARYRAEAAALLERERLTTESQVAAAREPLRQEAERLASDVVGKVLGRAA